MRSLLAPLVLAAGAAHAQIPQPEILFVFNDASGQTTLTNYGTATADCTVDTTGQTEGVDWAWHQNTGPFEGYWESLNNQGSDMAWIDCDAVAMPTTAAHRWGAIGFQLASFDTVTNTGCLYCQSEAGNFPGGFAVQARPTTGGGNFDLRVAINANGFERSNTFVGLSFGVDYQVVFVWDYTTPSAVTAKYKLNSDAVAGVSGTLSASGEPFAADAGYIGRGNDFDDHRGFTGRIYYLVDSSGDLLSDSDMDAINADPSVITGWPMVGGGSSAIPLVPQDLSRGFGPNRSAQLGGLLH